MQSLKRIVLLILFCGVVFAPPLSAQTGHPTAIEAGQSFRLPSLVYGDERTINVYLPSGYDESDTLYPVLYLLDGGTHQDFMPMVGMSALGALSGQYRSFILVGIQSEDRYYELTAPSTIAYDVKAIANNGGAEEFRRFIGEEVQPWVNENYRTSGENGVIGESLAGLFICETFLRAPQLFDHHVAVSPSLWWRGMGLSREAPSLLSAKDFPQDKSIFLTIASEGGTMLTGVEALAAALAEHAPEGTKWWYEPLPDEHHSTIYNPATLRALRHIFAPVAENKKP